LADEFGAENNIVALSKLASDKQLSRMFSSEHVDIPSYHVLGLDRYCAGARYLIPDTMGHSYTDTDTDTGLYKFFVLKMRFCAGYRCVQVIYVWGVYVRKYGIGLNL